MRIKKENALDEAMNFFEFEGMKFNEDGDEMETADEVDEKAVKFLKEKGYEIEEANLFKFFDIDDDDGQYYEYGWYYINASLDKIEKEKEDYLATCLDGDADMDFYAGFLSMLKEKYSVEEYQSPFYCEIKY